MGTTNHYPIALSVLLTRDPSVTLRNFVEINLNITYCSSPVVPMSTDVLANFGCLDELAQVVYQSVHRFVVLSSVSDTWTIHLGLAGPEGRWWRGSLGEVDILRIVVRAHSLYFFPTVL